MSERDQDLDLEQDKPVFFVSRRARAVGVNQVDLSEIDIESEQPAKAPSKKSTVKQKKTVKPEKKQPSVPPVKPERSRLPRKKMVVTGGVLLALIMTPIAVGEIVAAQYRGGITTARAEMDRIVKTSVLPLQKKPTLSAEQLGAVAADVDGIVGSMCRGGLLDNMASLYPRADTALKDCKRSQETYAALVSSLRQLEAGARYLEQAGKALGSAMTPITDAYAVIDAQHTAWKKAAADLRQLSPSAVMRPAHDTLVTHVSAIAENWSKLSQASNAQDAAGFMEAEKTLASEYEAVRSTSGAMAQSVQTIQSKVTTSYANLER